MSKQDHETRQLAEEAAELTRKHPGAFSQPVRAVVARRKRGGITIAEERVLVAREPKDARAT